MDTSGVVTAINLTAVGDDNTTRDGRQINVVSCHIRGGVSPVDTETSDSFGRWLLVWDKQPNSGAIATIAQILTTTSSYANTNLDNRERFVILRDKEYQIGGTSRVATQAYSNCPNQYAVNEFVKIGCKTTYSGTTAVIGSIATGALLLVTIGSTAIGTGGTLLANTRVRFSDN